MIAHRQLTPEELLQEAEPLTAAAREAVREALAVHKKLGNSIVVWRDGKVVIVPPEKIVVDSPPSNGNGTGQGTAGPSATDERG
ncbi:MAG TPA: hypothetical protein VJ809_12605 [Pirellulales bacterium]|jgi:hypothetical protein|nr:hypothetical protein [Pirellulales bacterium]